MNKEDERTAMDEVVDWYTKAKKYDGLWSLRGLLLTDPVTGDEIEIASDLKVNDDCSSEFLTRNRKTGAMWKHRIHTEEWNPEKNWWQE